MVPNFHYKTIEEISGLLMAGKLSVVDLVESQLGRINELDGHLKAYATVMSHQALKDAKKADTEISNGNYRGFLHGIPIAVKDLCYTAGVRTMGGSAVFLNNIPTYDSTVVRLFREAGAIIIGKLNLTEGAMSFYNPKFDIPQNPWKPDHWSGASSSGSGCATASGMAFGTIGTDTGGSIRHPSAVCGTVGLKPTWGRVSRFGVMDLAQSLDHVGPLTRSSIDAGIILQSISGSDPNDKTSLPHPVPNMLTTANAGVKGLRIGYDEHYANEDMEKTFAESIYNGVKTMEKLGASIVPIKMPKNLRNYMDAWQIICSTEAASNHGDTFPSKANEYGPFFKHWLETGNKYSGKEYAEANIERQKCSGEINQLMKNIDVFACPSTAKAAYPVNDREQYGPVNTKRDPWNSRFTVPTNFCGLPTISLPSGLDGNGLPLSIQFIGHHLSEPTLIQVGNAFEKATDFHELHPPV